MHAAQTTTAIMFRVARVLRPVVAQAPAVRAAVPRMTARFYSAGGDDALSPAEFDAKWKVRFLAAAASGCSGGRVLPFSPSPLAAHQSAHPPAFAAGGGLCSPPQAYFEDVSLTSKDVRRGLNDVFAHDLVPATPILEAALRATRRVNDFPTCVTSAVSRAGFFFGVPWCCGRCLLPVAAPSRVAAPWHLQVGARVRGHQGQGSRRRVVQDDCRPAPGRHC